jgi:hypothetical protein
LNCFKGRIILKFKWSECFNSTLRSENVVMSNKLKPQVRIFQLLQEKCKYTPNLDDSMVRLYYRPFVGRVDLYKCKWSQSNPTYKKHRPPT